MIGHLLEVHRGAIMDIILLDWTRMGRVYCLAGAVVGGAAGQMRIVRPLPHNARKSPQDHHGWSPFQMDGHSRWEIFEMVQPGSLPTLPPHLEDTCVAFLRPHRKTASLQQRKAILQATLASADKPLFGAELKQSYGGCYAEPGAGERSLTSVVVPASEVRFTALWRDGANEPDYRVRLPLPGLDNPILPVKDHVLLCRVEREPDDLDFRVQFLRAAILQMGKQVVVRLGLSRPFPSANGQPGRCWLMADGFFSLDDPQP